MAYFSKELIKKKIQSEGFQKYFKNTSWVLASRVLCMAISFVTTTFIARHLGPTNFGQLSYAISFVAIFSFLPALGIDAVLYKELIENPDKKSEFLGSALTIKFSASVFTMLLVMVSALHFAQDDVSRILIFILSTTSVFNSFLVVNNEFQARVQSKYPSLVSLLVTIILNVLKVTVIYFNKGVIYLALVLLFEAILYAGFYLVGYVKIIHGKLGEWRFKKEIAITLLHDSWPLIFSNAFALIYGRIDQVFIKHMLDAAAVGVYDSAVRIAEVWYFIPSIFIISLTPAIVNASTTSRALYNARVKKLFGFIFLLNFFTALAVTILAPFIIKILYGTEFLGGIKILQIYVWTSIPISTLGLSVTYLLIEKNRSAIFFSSLIPMVINVALNLLWIPQYGIVGSAYATLISYSLGPLSLLLFKDTRRKITTLFTHH
jgi:O-antigen/teichoic acid export membrane protein